MGKSDPVSTGLLWLDSSHLPLVKVWAKHARKYPDLPDDFVLEFLLREYDLPFTYIETEFFDRLKNSQIIRGQWKCEAAARGCVGAWWKVLADWRIQVLRS